MDEELAFGYNTYYDYTSTASPNNGNSPGYPQVLDIDSNHAGEPIFNVCRSLPTLTDQACVYAEVAVIYTGRIDLKDNTR